MKHKHADLIHAWADGAEIQVKDNNCSWWDCAQAIAWLPHLEYRIKPEEKKPVVRWLWAWRGEGCIWYTSIFLTDDEARKYFNIGDRYFKLEWSKQEFPE